MKRTPVLLRQHIGRYAVAHWRVQGKKKIIETGAEQILKKKNIPIYEATDLVRHPPVAFDETHPDWHDKPILSCKDDNVLLEGLSQAKILTNTVELKEGLPDSIALKDIPKQINNRVQNIILGSWLFDAEQKKLPIVKDPERPAWNFPRTYGVTRNRVCKLLTARLLQLIETTCGRNDLVSDRYLINDLLFSYPFERQSDLIQFQLSGDTVVTTINSSVKKSHPHTIFTRFNREEVKNLYEEEVTVPQIYGRSLLKAFTVCASYAKNQYGDEVKLLPKPVTVQAVQTDGCFFHFGVFQLNTLDLENGDVKNVWYQTPLLNLFERCCYDLGRPTLEGYNSEVVKHLYAFYHSV
ncbi:hypothetical protein NQ315_009877 [Exocentrus adspersus]|uniref:Large ribosomal subunit protein mL37 n=1 Tax=Exocentrus adspersus TaxID=1586481 RepID=A0AAV8WIQ5_9CUCU|nr:hypothetical protein NQ315_009877 [Exocentrus adspersus]